MSELKWKPLRLTSVQEYSEEILREVFGLTPEQIEANTVPGLYGLRLRDEERARLAADEEIKRG